MAKAQEQIASAYRTFTTELPALEKLKLVVRVELRGRGDVQVFGVDTPGPQVSKGEPDSPRLDIHMSRAEFNELADDGSLKDWHAAYDRGEIKVGGDPAVVKLLGTVIGKHEARAATKRAH